MGGFQGNCHYCGAYGHRINECRKKDADMKGKGKGGSGIAPPFAEWTPYKGKGKGQNSSGKGKGGWGKG